MVVLQYDAEQPPTPPPHPQGSELCTYFILRFLIDLKNHPAEDLKSLCGCVRARQVVCKGLWMGSMGLQHQISDIAYGTSIGAGFF